jgi:4-hydroxybenzoate polyprenyltransferase
MKSSGQSRGIAEGHDDDHTDLRPDHWIIRIAPEKIRPYLVLARLDRPVGIWLLLLPCWWSIALASGGWQGMTWREWMIGGVFAVGSIVMRAAGCVINDLWDRDLDRQISRTRRRPLAAGTISVKQAVIFLAALFLVGLIVLLMLDSSVFILAVISVLFVAVYPLMKRGGRRLFSGSPLISACSWGGQRSVVGLILQHCFCTSAASSGRWLMIRSMPIRIVTMI